MRFPFLLLVVGVALWLGFGAPVPVVVDKPLEVNPDLLSWDETQEFRQLLHEAVQNGRVPQEPKRRRLREDVLRALDRLRSWPCNEGVRQEMVAAATAWLRDGKERGPAVEFYSYKGKERSASGYFDHPILGTLEQADRLGQIRDGDIPNDLEQWIGLGTRPDPKPDDPMLKHSDLACA